MERTRSRERNSFDGGKLIPHPGRLRKVLVVGAGVAGLQTARQMTKLGAQVLVLEANAEVGGVWMRNYIGFGLQVPWRMYQFPEFPWPKHLQPSSEYPTGQEVQEYVQAYCREYDLRRHIRFNCKLLRLRWSAVSRHWDALYCDTWQEKFFKVSVDYAVICAGIYSQPYIPDYEGTDSYAGIQLHAKDFVDLSLARGRRVVIVGAGKTALDCVSSIVATNTATSVTLLYRQAHWPLPRCMLGTSVRRLLFNRAMTAMMPPYYTASRSSAVASKAMAPLKKLFWRSMESVISRKFRITEQMRPRVHLPVDLFYGGQILDNTMDKLVRSEALMTVKGEINRFVRNGVILQDGNFVAADLVLYCTGYLKTYDYLEGDMRSRLDLQKDGLYLYRNCLPYAVPHLAFIGSEVSTYNNILTHGLQALWLAHVLSGRIQLPSPADMAEDVRAQQRWRRAVMPAQRSRGSVLMLYMMQYHDQLLADMGQASHRKGVNLFAECFAAYTAKDYHDLMTADDTVLAPHSPEEQLAAAGVPPAVLAAAAAAAAGHSGVLPSVAGVGADAGAGVAAAGGDTERRIGTTGGALTATDCTLDGRFYSGSSQAGCTSVSIRSCSNGRDWMEGQGVAAVAAVPAVATATYDASPGAAGAAGGSGTASCSVLREPSGVKAVARTGSPHSMGPASTGRLSQVEWDPDLAAGYRAAMQRSVASATGVVADSGGSGGGGGEGGGGGDGGGGAGSVTTCSQSHASFCGRRNPIGSRNRSARAINVRNSADLEMSARWRGGCVGIGGGCHSDCGPAVRRPPSTTPTTALTTSSAFVLKGVSRPAAAAATATAGADCSDSVDVRPAAPRPALPAAMRQGTLSAALSAACGNGGGSGGSGAIVATAVAATAAAAVLSVAVPGSYLHPSSSSRLSRHTGPSSPIPCQSTRIHANLGSPSQRGQGDIGGLPGQQQPAIYAHRPQQQHLKWSLQSGDGAAEAAAAAAEAASSGGSGSGSGGGSSRAGTGSGCGGGRSTHLRSVYGLRIAPDIPLPAAGAAAAAAAAAANLSDSIGFLCDCSSGPVSRASCEDWQQPGSIGFQNRSYTHQRTGTARCFTEPSSAALTALRSHVDSPMGPSQCSSSGSRPLGLPALLPAPNESAARGVGHSSQSRGNPRGGGGGGSGRGSDRGLCSGEQQEGSAEPVPDPRECSGVRCAGGDGGGVGGGRGVCAAGGPAAGGATDVRSPLATEGRSPSAATSGSLMSNQVRKLCRNYKNNHKDNNSNNKDKDQNSNNNTNNNSCVPLGSNSGGSQALSSYSQRGSSSGNNTSGDCSSETEAAVAVVSGGVAATPALIKTYPVAEDADRTDADAVVGSSQMSSPALSPEQASTPAWHASVSEHRHLTCGSMGGLSEGAHGSPGSSAVSLSFWHVNPFTFSSGGTFMRPGHSTGARGMSPVESRFGAMGRLEAKQLASSGDETEQAPGHEASVVAATAGAASVAAFVYAGSNTGRPMQLGSGAAVGIHLGSSSSDLRRTSSLACESSALAEGGTGGDGGCGGGGSWLLPVTFSGGAQSMTSNGGGQQMYSLLSPVGEVWRSTPAVAASPQPPPLPETIVRQPSRLSCCATVDSIAPATLPACTASEVLAAAQVISGGGRDSLVPDLDQGSGGGFPRYPDGEGVGATTEGTYGLR